MGPLSESVERRRRDRRVSVHPPIRRWALRLIFVGLLVELASLVMLHHPIGFLTFALGGGTLLVAGVLCYVTSLFREGASGG